MNRPPGYLTEDLLRFLNASPTAFHAVDYVKTKLIDNGFIEVRETQSREIKPASRYFVTRNDSSICAFITPIREPLRARLLASHTDSPSLKIKPQPEIRNRNMILFGVEIYGTPLLSSWLNRDLGIAGRVIYRNVNNDIESRLVRLDEAPLIIPQLAVHLDREVNEKGLILNKQEHLKALATLTDGSWDIACNYLDVLLRKKLNYQKIINFDLFLFPLEPAKTIGYGSQMISSYRIDNLASLHASMEALLQNLDPLENDIKMLISWDNEEIGSGTMQGAGSTFVSQILERILLSRGLGREAFFPVLHNSLCISLDLAHALHPNYNDKHDPDHPVLPGKGIAVKTNAQYRYASNGMTCLPIQVIAETNGIPLQYYVSRNDIPCGTTIGPIHSALSGMPTVDIGCSQLSMHSSREIMAAEDHFNLYKLLRMILEAPALPAIQLPPETL